jgi:hypothetical protein
VISDKTSSVDLHIEQILYPGLEELLHPEKLVAVFFVGERAGFVLSEEAIAIPCD